MDVYRLIRPASTRPGFEHKLIPSALVMLKVTCTNGADSPSGRDGARPPACRARDMSNTAVQRAVGYRFSVKSHPRRTSIRPSRKRDGGSSATPGAPDPLPDASSGEAGSTLPSPLSCAARRSQSRPSSAGLLRLPIEATGSSSSNSSANLDRECEFPGGFALDCFKNPF